MSPSIKIYKIVSKYTKLEYIWHLGFVIWKNLLIFAEKSKRVMQ